MLNNLKYSTGVMVVMIRTLVTKEEHLNNMQRTHWYALNDPAHTAPQEGEYVDYHLAPDPLPGPLLQSSAPPSIQTEGDTNVTAVLGQTVKLSCTVMGFRQEEHTVSWTKKHTQENPIALTFNDKVFVSDSRINVYIDIDTWVLVLYNVTPSDQATYECHLNSEPPQKLTMHLTVRVPVMRVTDGFGRNLTDQFYKTGSSLEIGCEVDTIPSHLATSSEPPLLEWRHQGRVVSTRPMQGISIQTEVSGSGVYSRLAITQANSVHEGKYSCSVPGYISAPVRIHIIQDENQAFVASGNTNISCKLEWRLVTNFLKISQFFVALSLFTWMYL